MGHCLPAWDYRSWSLISFKPMLSTSGRECGALDATGGWELLVLCYLVLFLALISLCKIQEGGRVVWAGSPSIGS